MSIANRDGGLYHDPCGFICSANCADGLLDARCVEKILLRIIVGRRSDYGKIRIFVRLAFALSCRKVQLKSSFATLAQKAIDLFIRMGLLPWFSSITFSGTTSKMRTSLCCANSMAKERPTYPIPATAICISTLFFYLNAASIRKSRFTQIRS